MNASENKIWIPITTMNFDWFETAKEYVEFFVNTLNRWSINAIQEKDTVLCAEQGFKLVIEPHYSECITNIPTYAVTMQSNGKHIDTMLFDIIECLRVQANSKTELTEDEAFALIDVELKNMNESQLQMHLGRNPRENIDEWVQELSGLCNDLTRVSFGKFVDAVINVSLHNLDNICEASFVNCRFSSLCALKNVMFVGCIFENVEFDCIMDNVTFSDCVMKAVTFPGKRCDVRILNSDYYEEIEYDDA